MFLPGDRTAAAGTLGLDDRRRSLLFVGRIQPLKGADLAVRASPSSTTPRATLVVVGGPSGPDGDGRARRARTRSSRELGVDDRVRFVPPQPHDRLADFYRAADVCIVPSRTESFGLVALEAAACGTPVVAADVGGLRSLVDDGAHRLPRRRPRPARRTPRRSHACSTTRLAARWARHAVARSRRYSWSITAARLRRLYADLVRARPRARDDVE